MRKWLLVTLLCSLTLLTACSASSVRVQESLKTEVVVPAVDKDDEVHAFEDVLFVEIPNSENAARNFLSVIRPMGLQLKHATIKDYSYGNYTIDCKFTNDKYTILIYVHPEAGVTKWYGSLKLNGKEVTMWQYDEVKGDST